MTSSSDIAFSQLYRIDGKEVTYDEFACFCKSSHEEKTRSIEELEASVASLSAEYRPSLEIYWSIASA